MRALRCLAFVAFWLAVFFGIVGGIVWASGSQVVPDCQTWTDGQYTGWQTVAGHRVWCFHGHVVKVVGYGR